MSEPKKPRSSGDPFDGMDWDKELDDWDKSTSMPNKVSVPESFSSATPPPVVAKNVEAPPPEKPAAPPGGPPKAPPRPLYRPPPAPSRDMRTPLAHPSPPHLASLLDDVDESKTRSRDDDDDVDESTVIAPVSRDLLAELEKAGFPRRQKPADPVQQTKATVPPPPAPPVVEEIAAASNPVDLGELDERAEPTADHPPPALDDEDPSVVTSAPDFLAKVRAATRPVETRGPAIEHHVGDGEMFDPFRGMDVEPPVSESVKRPPSNAPGPRLLAPERRKHSDSDETAVFDKRALRPPEARPLDPDATSETAADPFAASADPFGAPDPFEKSAGDDSYDSDGQATTHESASATLEVGEEADAAAIIDLLGGDENTGEQPVAGGAGAELSSSASEELPASEWIGDEVDEWKMRAERIANDARNKEKGPKARGLVIASEIAAIAGDRVLAITLAEEAWEAVPGDALAVRQLRQLLAAEGRWDEVAPLLEQEAKQSTHGAVKANASILAADAARLARAAPDEATKLYEAAQRAVPGDVRPVLARALSALSAGKSLPLLRWPAGAEPLGEAISRRAKGGEPVEDVALATMIEGVGQFAEKAGGVEGSLAAALEELASSETLGPAVQWLHVALDAVRPKARAAAADRLAEVPPGRAAIEARLALSLDLGDVGRATSAAAALAKENPDARTQLALTALASMSHAIEGSLEGLTSFAASDGVVSLGRAVAIATMQDPPAAFASSDSLDAATRVAGRFVRGEAIDGELRLRTSRGAQLGFTFGDALAAGSPRGTLEALAPLMTWPSEQSVEEPLARSFAALAEGDAEATRTHFGEAIAADPTTLPVAYALLASGDPDGPALSLGAVEATVDDARAAALALHVGISSVLRGDLETAKRAIELALLRTPDDAAAAFVGEIRARRGGDFDGVVEAIRARAKSTTDPVARTEQLVREVFLLLGGDLATCIDRANEAAQLAPKDPTVRALYERIAGEGAQGRAEWRAEIAESLSGVAKAETLLDAAREAERHGDLESSERHAVAAEKAGAGFEATTLRHRVQSRGDGAARLAEELIEVAKNATDPSAQRETYEQLADLDLYARHDTASAVLWHRAILETTPGHLPSLRRLEHMLVGEGREDDYESIASELARTLPADARDAHAEVAARLRLRRDGTPWESITELILLATEREKPSYWGVRMLDALARMRTDDRALLRVTDLLLARSERPAEVAAISTRAAEASFRLGDVTQARAALERALEADPQHPTALASMAELRRHAGDVRGAAESIEAMAQTQLVAEHRLEDWHAAAVLWLDHVADKVRGRAALERAAEIDLAYGDVFERLVTLARASREQEVLADLYARRLQQLEEPDARASLQVEYAQVLVELGDRDGARSALSEALEVAPGNLDALREGARLAEEAEDWPDLETYLLRLTDAQAAAEDKLLFLRRLGAIYEGPYPDDAKAEGVYRRLLEHQEDDEIYRRLVDVYVRVGDGEQAVETHKERVRLATDPAMRRARLIELAKLLDEQAGDPERALKALEQARAGDPADLVALGALAEFHTKHGHPELVSSALDGAAADLRNRLAGDAGNVELLEQLQKILDLRGRKDAMATVHSVLLGLSGNVGELIGAEDAASLADLDALLCPAELTPAFRELLVKAGDALEKSVPVDLRALKAAKLGTSNPVLKAKIDAVSRGFGLPDPDVVISRAMPFLCLPVGAKPFQIVLGDAVVSTDDEVARRFVLYRAMKACGAHCASLIRVPSSDLKVFLDVLLHHLHPEHPAPAIEPERLDEITKRLQRFIPRKDEAELKTLAAAVVAEGVPNTDALAAAAATWADRVALLAVGDVGAALRGVAWTLGQKDAPPQGVAARREWLLQNPAARDLVAFALSDTYLEARRRAGVA